MSTPLPCEPPSAEAIRRKYYGSTAESSALNRPSDFTASARYVIREARKRLAQTEDAVVELGEDQLFSLVSHVENTEGEELSERERTAVVAALAESLDDFDILTPLIENPSVNDIIVRSYCDISVQSGRANYQTDMRFSDRDAYRSFVEQLLKRVGKACTTGTPVVDAALSPDIRICVTHESFSPAGCGPMLTVRIARHAGISLPALTALELAPAIVLDYLGALVASGQCTVLVAGEVGTGKTTLVRALASRIPESEAILVIEDTQEVVLSRRFVRTLLTREANTEGAGRISPAQAIRTGMRMAMNRIILGEMRDAETAEAFIDVCASGHAGMSTIHARSARDAISRLELFLSRAQGHVSVEAIRRQIANALSVVVYVGLDKKFGKRRITEVVEVGTSSDGVVQVSPIFSFDSRAGTPCWVRSTGMTMHGEMLKEAEVNLPFAKVIVPLDFSELRKEQRG